MTTKTIELDESALDTVVDCLRGYKPSGFSNEEMLEVASEIEQQLEYDTPDNAILITGLPAAGKTFVAAKLSVLYDCEYISMGDAVRWQYHLENSGVDIIKRDYEPEVQSYALAEFAKSRRRIKRTQVADWTIELVRRVVEDENLVIIDGLRSPHDYDGLTRHFDTTHLIEVEASFEVRLGRIQERARDGEEHFSRVDLAERDQRELEEHGQRELLNKVEPELTVRNSSGEKNLKRHLRNVNAELPYKAYRLKAIGL